MEAAALIWYNSDAIANSLVAGTLRTPAGRSADDRRDAPGLPVRMRGGKEHGSSSGGKGLE